MSQLTSQTVGTGIREPEHVGSASMVLQRLAERLQRQQADKILDLGPVCQDNINFFAGRAKQLYVCDLFTRLQRIKKAKNPSGLNIWEHLDFPADSFDCINVWDLLDHLTDDEAFKIVKRCYEMIKPFGLVLVTAMEKALHPHHSTLFAYDSDFRLTTRSLTNIQLPSFYRHNRAFMSLLEPFKPMKIFRYHNGIREMLFQRSNRS